MTTGYKITNDASTISLPELYADFCKKEIFTDVTLVSDDFLPLSAHRIVLGAASPVFQKLLTVQSNSQGSNSILYIKGIQHEILQLLIQFIYHGVVVVKADSIKSFIKVAEDLEIRDLCNEITRQEENLNIFNNEMDGMESVSDDYVMNELSEVEIQTLNEICLKNLEEEKELDLQEQKEDTIEKEIETKVNCIKKEKKCKLPRLCKDCGLTFMGSQKKHMRQHDKALKCCYCEFKTGSRKTLGEHKLSQHVNEYICKHCNYIATSKSLLRKHKTEIHPSSFLYNCDQCEYKGKLPELLTRHKEHYHSHDKSLVKQEDRPRKAETECSDCGKKYSEKSCLLKHIKSAHKGIKHICHLCGYKGTTSTCVKNHIKSMHEGITYSCDLCTSVFKFKGGLNSHIKSAHDGIRYACNFCDYKATQPNGLKYHEKALHFNKLLKIKSENGN